MQQAYIIISATRSPDLEEKVNAALQQGYIPVGGLAIQDGVAWQAMILASEVE